MQSPIENGGLCLTWEDLCVDVSNGKSLRKVILENVTGVARPGEVLAVMGPSGCGKSTLLDALAGRLDLSRTWSGGIRVNGRAQQQGCRTSAYVTQEDDTLIPTLTVREVIFYSAQLQLPTSMSWSEKLDRADITIKEMGLQGSKDTRIGGSWGEKGGGGLSGGQKRRVSICIEILKRPKLLFLDEPTSGLDSAASFYVMDRIARLEKLHRMTVLAAVHQPGNDVFQAFDSLCLLSLRRCVFFGPAHAANELFAANGFPCPSLQNPSDHYLKTINTDFVFDQDIEEGSTAEETVAKLVKSYKSSDIFKQARRYISDLNRHDKEGSQEVQTQASFLAQCSILTRRSFVNMYRDLGYYWLRLAIYIALALGVGTVFYDIGNSYSSIQARGSMLMFVASFLTIMAIGGFPSFVEDLKVSRRERLNGHYGATAFVVANTLSSTPYLILNSLIPGTIVYFLVGLQQIFTHFIFFASTLLACMLMIESLTMTVATLMPNFLMGLITGAGIQGLMILSGGFFRLPNDLPKLVWKYPLYYIAFHKYAFQGLYKNEFQGLTFPGSQGGLDAIQGDDILKNVWQVEVGYSKWVDLAILFGMVILYRVLFLCVIKVSESAKILRRKLDAYDPLQKPKQESVNPYPIF